MLEAFDVKYLPCIVVKGQVLADFVAEFTEDVVGDERLGPSVLVASTSFTTTLEVYTNGAANQKGSRVGIVLVTLEKLVVERSFRLGFLAVNNEAEYETLLAGMAMVGRLGGEVIEIYSDSRLVVGLVNGEFEARDQRMQGYLIKFKRAQSCFKSFALRKILRGQNSYANSLVMLATSSELGLPRVIIVKDLVAPSHDDQLSVRVHSIQVGLSWMDPLVSFLKQGLLPKDRGEAEKIHRKASWYWLLEEQNLYKRSNSGPYLLCVHPKAVEPLLEELHKGIYGSHTERRFFSS